MSLEPVWLHVDINSYFATVLQQEVPPLRGKPIGIVKQAGRNCIIAASNEAKKFGVKTGSLLSDARRKCPQLITYPAPFDQCLSATKRLRRLFARLSPDSEIFSLDEAFIYFTPLSKLYASPQEFAALIQKEIKNDLGEWVGCNVGIGKNRLLAKIASEISPKGSVFTINDQNQAAILSKIDFADVCGVGYRLEKKLSQLGVRFPYQINFIDDETLISHCGPYWARELRKIGKGEEPELLAMPKFRSTMKSIGRSITGYRSTRNSRQIRQIIYNLCTEVIYKARQLDLAGRQPWIALYGSRGEYWSDFVTLSHHVWHTSEFFKIIYHQLYQKSQPRFAVIKFAVRLGLMDSKASLTESLLPHWSKQEKVSKAIDSLTQKYGLFAVRSGLMVEREKLIMPEVTGFLGDQAFQFRNE